MERVVKTLEEAAQGVVQSPFLGKAWMWHSGLWAGGKVGMGARWDSMVSEVFSNPMHAVIL